MRRVPALVVFLFFASYSPVLRAQSRNASLTGRVTDPSKALIAEAKISAINTATNFRYETSTNASGEYYLPSLPPGLYQLEVESVFLRKNRILDRPWLGERSGIIHRTTVLWPKRMLLKSEVTQAWKFGRLAGLSAVCNRVNEREFT